MAVGHKIYSVKIKISYLIWIYIKFVINLFAGLIKINRNFAKYFHISCEKGIILNVAFEICKFF